MKSSKLARMKLSRIAAFAAVVAAVAWFLGCGDDLPTGIGSPLRAPPDSLRLLEFTTIDLDSTYEAPISLGRAPKMQIGSRYPYRAHILYDFRIPTQKVSGTDTLRLDRATLSVRSDSFLTAPFDTTESMRIGMQEVAPAGRFWSEDAYLDSSIVVLPPLEPEPLARDALVAGAGLKDHTVRLQFDLDLTRIAGYDSVRAAGGTLEVNIALVFEAFEPSVRGGFLSMPALEQLLGTTNDQSDVATVGPRRRRTVVEIDGNYTPGTNLVVSDGFRLHAFVQFDSLRNVLPDSALVYLAELVMTQVDSPNSNFSSGNGENFLGVIVPRDAVPFTEKGPNDRRLDFSSRVVPLGGTTVTITVTPYIVEQQEGVAPNRGMILGLSDEGTRIRHFEFYGAAAADSLRPRLRLVYGFPAPFEGGRR